MHDAHLLPTVIYDFELFPLWAKGADYISGALASYIAEPCVGVLHKFLMIKASSLYALWQSPSMLGIAELESTGWVWEADRSERDLSATVLVLTGCAFWIRTGMNQ